MDQEDNFKEDFVNIYSEEEYDQISEAILLFLEGAEEKIKTVGVWCMSVSIEKHDALNETLHFDISKEGEDGEYNDTEICLSYYTGIDVGCELIDYSFSGESLQYKPKYVTALTDIKPNWAMYNAMFPDGYNESLIQYKIDSVKDEIMEIYQKQNYDNYVTGGGTCKTNSHYKNKLDEFRERSIYWECIYEEVEVDRNIK